MQKLQTVNAETLLYEPLEKPSFVVDSLIPTGLSLFCGSQKIGKSWLMLKLCLCVSQGIPLWDIDKIKNYTICIDDIRLVRYYDKKTPLFCEALISEFKNRELNYKTNCPLSFDKYLKLITNIWKRFADNIDESIDYFIFDGTLLHHTINDLIRNYNANSGQIVEFVNSLLASLGFLSRKIFYLKTDDICKQLKAARANRNQKPPAQKEIDFWINRYRIEINVIPYIDEDCKIFDISDNKWTEVEEEIINTVSI